MMLNYYSEYYEKLVEQVNKTPQVIKRNPIPPGMVKVVVDPKALKKNIFQASREPKKLFDFDEARQFLVNTL